MRANVFGCWALAKKTRLSISRFWRSMNSYFWVFYSVTKERERERTVAQIRDWERGKKGEIRNHALSVSLSSSLAFGANLKCLLLACIIAYWELDRVKTELCCTHLSSLAEHFHPHYLTLPPSREWMAKNLKGQAKKKREAKKGAPERFLGLCWLGGKRRIPSNHLSVSIGQKSVKCLWYPEPVFSSHELHSKQWAINGPPLTYWRVCAHTKQNIYECPPSPNYRGRQAGIPRVKTWESSQKCLLMILFPSEENIPADAPPKNALTISVTRIFRILQLLHF